MTPEASTQLHLRDLMTNPPGMFNYSQPESGMSMQAITFPSLLKKVAQHRENMKYPAVREGFRSLGDEIEQSICESLSPADQVEFCENGARKRGSIPWREILDFLVVAKSWVVKGLVDQTEAERRAAICADCPYNLKSISGCPLCRTAINEFREKILSRSTPFDSKLGACSICSCENRVTVHVPLESLETVPHDFSGVSWCWRNRGVAKRNLKV